MIFTGIGVLRENPPGIWNKELQEIASQWCVSHEIDENCENKVGKVFGTSRSAKPFYKRTLQYELVQIQASARDKR